MPRLDVVVPVFNEAACLTELVRRMRDVRQGFTADDVDMHLILVDDGSRDGSADVVDELAATLPWVAAVHLTRNFGHQAAMTAGLDASAGDYVSVIDADLQDPPELIQPMLRRLIEKDVDVVYGVRDRRDGESRFKLKTASLFYRMLRRSSGIDIPLDTGDFRVMKARVVVALRALPEHNRFLRALVPWLGYSAIGFSYTRDRRYAGDTKYPLRKMITLAAHAIFAFSTMPIRLVQLAGFALIAVGGFACTAVGALQLFDVVNPGTAAWLLLGMTVQTGLIVLSVGVVGGYVFRIQDEVKGRPLYVRADIGPAGTPAVLPPPSESISLTER
ncbi:MAG: glycosyltransferase family 2 protein [Actinomycetota bacterium]|nr:glycosyltransferase family 2 protein [Actinomycetota bacterium]